MWNISLARIQRYALILGLVGAVATAVIRSPLEAVGFLVGAALSVITIQSWGRLAESLTSQLAPSERTPSSEHLPGGRKPGSPALAGLFMVLRYVLIGGAIYATIKVLGVTPVAILAGLLVSFLAVVIELVSQATKPR